MSPPPADDAVAVSRVVVVGDDGVAVRVREELELSGVGTTSVCAAGSTAAEAAAAAGAELVLGDPTQDATWERARAAGAAAVGLLGPGDLQNLDAALLVGELAPGARLVVRTGSSDLRTGIQRLLGGRAEVISETEVAAPAFLRAALSGNEGQRVRLAGRLLEVAEVDRQDPRLVAALCDPDHVTEVLPPVDALPPLVLGLIAEAVAVRAARGALPASVAAHHRDDAGADEGAPIRQRRPSPLRRARLQLRLLPGRAWVLLTAIALVGSVSTAVFSLAHDLTFINALYFTVTTMATVGYGDINLVDEGAAIKVYDIGLMAVSAVLLACVLAVVTDVVVSSRIDRALGRFPRPHADHVVVCGLGRLGSRVLEALNELGVPCIAVERDTEAVGVAVARDLQVPVVFADARDPETLDRLHLDRAMALMAVTSDDLANVQAGLAARDDRADLRVVMRIFDSRLAARIDRSDPETLTRSVSALSAPAFTAALLGRSLAEPLAVSNLPLRVLSCEVPATSALVGRSVRALHAERDVRVIALGGRFQPPPDAVVAAGAPISVVGTREACDALGAASA